MDKYLEEGNIHWCVVYFDEPYNLGEFKKRPIVIIERDNNDIFFFRITSSKGGTHQEKYRVPLLNWRSYGLEKPSYINIEVPLLIRDKKFFNVKTHIAMISDIDARTLTKYLNDLGY